MPVHDSDPPSVPLSLDGLMLGLHSMTGLLPFFPRPGVRVQGQTSRDSSLSGARWRRGHCPGGGCWLSRKAPGWLQVLPWERVSRVGSFGSI